MPAGRELEFLWILRELARQPAPPGAAATDAETAATAAAPVDGDLRPLARRLLERFAAAPYVLLVFDAECDAAQQHALRALAATLASSTRFRLLPLRGGGNRVGAEAVLTWQTGFPTAVDFGSGVPWANGRERSAARLLAAGAVDAALVACANPAEYDSEPAFRALGDLPLVLLDSTPNPLAATARVVLRSAPYGLASGGTVFRMDGVALGLRPAVTSRYPTEAEWLGRLLLAVGTRGP